MLLQTFENDYKVTCVKERAIEYDYYICKNENKGGFFSVLAIKNKKLFPSVISFLADIDKIKAFTDYIEYFLFEDKLCVVMRYTQGISLRNKTANESLTINERLEIGRKLLERVVLQEIPDFFLCRCFCFENIVVENDLSVSFNYPVNDISDIAPCSHEDAMNSISTVLTELFSYEIERKVPEVMVAFFRNLPALLEEDMIEIYSAYHEMMTAIGNIPKDELEEPNSVWFKLWDKMKAFFSFMKKVVMAGFIIAALAYLIYTIDGAKADGGGKTFDSIGTVDTTYKQ